MTKQELKQLIKKFIKQSFTDNLKYGDYKGEYRGLNIQASFGKGTKSGETWIAFLGNGQKVSNGIYPLISFDYNDNKIKIVYGVSFDNPPKIDWSERIKNNKNIATYKNKNIGYLETIINGVNKNVSDNKLDEIIKAIDKVIDVYLEIFLTNEEKIILNFLKENKKKFSTKQLSEHLQKKHSDVFDKNPDTNFRNKLRNLEEKGFIKKEEKGNETLRWYYNIVLLKDVLETLYKEVFISEKDLYNILISLETTNFLIFSGPSGVGKTLLAEKIAKIFDDNNNNGEDKPENFFKFPVKSDFVDETSIFGYWNGLLSKYEGTEVLKFFIKAAKNPDIPYFLLLDEMNLSKIENYFSAFLSNADKLRQGKEGDEIILFETIIKNKEQYDNIKMILKNYFPDEDYEKFSVLFTFDEESLFDEKGNLDKEMLSNGIGKIKVFFKLPINLKVIGTINEDETTHSISNKVLDRCQFITFSVANLFSEDDSTEIDRILLNKSLDILNKDDYPKIGEIKDILEQQGFSDIKNIIKKLQDNIKAININDTIGYRTLEEIFYYMSKYTGEDLDKLQANNKHLLKALDYQIAQKILPKLKVYSLIKEDKKTAFKNIETEVLNKEEFTKSKEFYEYLKSNILE